MHIYLHLHFLPPTPAVFQRHHVYRYGTILTAQFIILVLIYMYIVIFTSLFDIRTLLVAT